MSMVFFMLTNILDEDTRLLCFGKDSPDLVKESFGAVVDDADIAYLPKVVSRKKQLIPSFMGALQNG